MAYQWWDNELLPWATSNELANANEFKQKDKIQSIKWILK